MLTEKIMKAVSDDIPNKLGKEDIINDLTTGGVDKVLSAEQGKTIKALKTEVEAMKDQVVNNRPIIIADDYPIGGFMWFTSLTAPEGWLICNGQGVNISDFPELFGVIGYTYGGEGTWFRVPDLTTKQDFIRSVSATGKVGDRQEDANKLHNHIIGVGNPVSDGKLFDQWHAVGVDTTGVRGDQSYYTAVTKVEGAGESRPKNIALAPFIKAKQRVTDMTTVAQEWTRFKENGGSIGGDINVIGDSYATRHVGGYDTQDKRYRISIDSYGDFAIQKITKSGEFLFNIIRDSYNDKGLGNIGLGCANLYFGASAVSKIGYSKLPNGLLIQWGRFGGSFSNGAYKQNIQFPVAFTTATPSISMSLLSAGGYDETEVITHATYPNQNQFALAMKQVGSYKGNHAFEISWIAIGY